MSMVSLRAVCLAALVCPALALGAQVRDSVWVNARSQVYHCPGTQYYGNTSRGEYLSEADAIARGARANGGKRCHPEPSTPTTGQGLLSVPEGLRGAPAGEPKAPVGPVTPCTLVRVTDGDSIDCDPVGRVRLTGIDSPELSQEPFGDAGRAGLASLVPMGAQLALEADAEVNDRYGRRLAYVWYEGRMVNWQLVRGGWAVAERYPPNVRYAVALEGAEGAAREEKRGLWGSGGFACRPRARREKKC